MKRTTVKITHVATMVCIHPEVRIGEAIPGPEAMCHVEAGQPGDQRRYPCLFAEPTLDGFEKS